MSKILLNKNPLKNPMNEILSNIIEIIVYRKIYNRGVQPAAQTRIKILKIIDILTVFPSVFFTEVGPKFQYFLQKI
jgi:hypothetical protein